MISKRIYAGLLIILLLVMTGCSKKNINETSESPKGIITYSSEASREHVDDISEETVKLETETTETSEKESETTETETEEETTPEVKADLVKFFGHGMASDVAEANRKTFEAEGSMLFDVLSEPDFTAEGVLRMIESYAMPQNPLIGGMEATDGVRNEISDYRNLEPLSKGSGEKLNVRYGILVNNSDIRSFPTELSATDSNDLFAFDYFQETVLPTASGVIVLHETADGSWSFVQGVNYYGWTKTENIGFCNQSVLFSYLYTDIFLVVIVPRANTNYGVYRLGTILPYTKKVNDEYMVKIPRRNSEGSFYYDILPVPNDGSFNEGFLDKDIDQLSALTESLRGYPYGWGDSGNYYDCSSTVGLIYQCFGYYMPRNTSAMKYFAGGAIDVTGMEDSEKLNLISEHPGAILVMPGHAMLYTGVAKVDSQKKEYCGLKHVVFHNTTGYYGDPDGEEFYSCYCVTESYLENMYRANGESFLQRISFILPFDENMAESAE